jgi:small-conductance mechanosensitive channel
MTTTGWSRLPDGPMSSTAGVADISARFAPRLDQIKARLAELGEPPKEGQPPEADIVTNERNALTPNGRS